MMGKKWLPSRASVLPLPPEWSVSLHPHLSSYTFTLPHSALSHGCCRTVGICCLRVSSLYSPRPSWLFMEIFSGVSMSVRPADNRTMSNIHSFDRKVLIPASNGSQRLYCRLTTRSKEKSVPCHHHIAALFHFENTDQSRIQINKCCKFISPVCFYWKYVIRHGFYFFRQNSM